MSAGGLVEHHQGVYGGWHHYEGFGEDAVSYAESGKKQQDYWEPGVPLGPAVRLNVYDLADIGMCVDLSEALASLNKHTMGLWEVGIFHAGVEISGVEYSFGYCEYGTGVYACEPRQAGGARFRTSIKMGRARYTARMVEARLSALAATWSGSSYSLVHRNCCHFCDTLCFSLGVGRVPAWVNGLAENVSKLSPWAPLPQTVLEARARGHAAFRRPDDDALAERREPSEVEAAEEAARAELPQNTWLLPFCAGIASCFPSALNDKAPLEPNFRRVDDDDDDDRRLAVLYHSRRGADDSFWRRVQCCGDPAAASDAADYSLPGRPADRADLDRYFQTLADESTQRRAPVEPPREDPPPRPAPMRTSPDSSDDASPTAKHHKRASKIAKFFSAAKKPRASP
mmetsp:Transcript_23318/g.73036  ORF Transcript_23318/g.73036 Transcript_23318/m.73036 type:complete len:399 (+) Transcript_23318:37-1233(+)